MKTKTRILLVDDHGIVRDGLKLLLHSQPDCAVVAEAADGRTALKEAKTVMPDLAIVDLHLPEMAGLELIQHLIECCPELRIIVLSADADQRLVREAVRLGVRGYLLKADAPTEILAAVRAVLNRQVYFSPAIAATVAEGYRQAMSTTDSGPLSEREVAVLRLLADGRSSKEIADSLGVGVTTVDTHRHKIMKRLGLFSVAELTKYAIREGLTKL